MNKKNIILIVFILVIIISFVTYKIYKNDFTNSIYVITEDEVNHKLNYYELNDRKSLRKVEKFEINDGEFFEVSKKCYKSYIDREKNKVLNQLNSNECYIYNQSKDKIEINDDYEKIVYLVSKLEHDIIGNTILKLDDDYFVVVELNVNLWSPYDLYKYDKDNNELKLIYTFDGENIIGIKYKQESD